MLSKPVSFFQDFFAANPQVVIPPLIATALCKSGDLIWSYLTLREVLNISVCSRFSASLVISQDTVLTFLESDKRISHIGHYKLSFSSDVTLGILRRMLARVVVGTEAVLAIDSTTGRVILDIGSAFKDRDAYLAATVVPVVLMKEEGPSSEDPNAQILKYLEVSSYDEYDDFAPRHPNPREKTHRRGDSFFNSDITDIAQEALASLTMSSIATMNLNLEIPPSGMHKSTSVGRISRVQSRLGIPSPHSGGLKSGATASSDEEEEEETNKRPGRY